MLFVLPGSCSDLPESPSQPEPPWAYTQKWHAPKQQIPKSDRTEKSETKAKKLQAKADAEGDLADTTSTRDADQKYLDDLVATCEQKSSDY